MSFKVFSSLHDSVTGHMMLKNICSLPDEMLLKDTVSGSVPCATKMLRGLEPLLGGEAERSGSVQP